MEYAVFYATGFHTLRWRTSGLPFARFIDRGSHAICFVGLSCGAASTLGFRLVGGLGEDFGAVSIVSGCLFVTGIWVMDRGGTRGSLAQLGETSIVDGSGHGRL
jgi:hypothetical protein